MADFVPDGHKYGWRFSKNWAPGAINNVTQNISLKSLRIVVPSASMPGGDCTLGLAGYYSQAAIDNLTPMPIFFFSEDATTFQCFFILSAESSFPPTYSYKFLRAVPSSSDIEANQYIARLTVTNKGKPCGIGMGSTNVNTQTPASLFVFDDDIAGHIINTFDEPDLSLDYCLEFSADTPAQVKSISITPNYTERITTDTNFILYADDIERQLTSADFLEGESPAITPPVPVYPMSCLYKDPSGALYQLDTSVYATQAEYQSLLARVAALEAAKAGA